MTLAYRTLATAFLAATAIGRAFALDITLEQCERSARENHPLAAQNSRIDRSERATREAANDLYLPRLSLSSKATSQSDTTSVTSPIISIAGDPNQWQITGDASQLLFDGGAIEAQKKALAAGADVERRQLAVNLESVRSQVRENFFLVILLDSQLAQNRLLAQELADNREKLTAFLANGVAIQSDIDAIRVEELKTRARESELGAGRSAALFALSRLTGLELGADSHFVRPSISTEDEGTVLDSRTEFALFAGREAAKEAERAALRAGLLPKISAFAQVGYGKPGLNMLTANADSWWLVGIRGTWTIDNLYSYGANGRKIDASIAGIEAERASFRLGEEIRLRQKEAEIERLAKAIALDEQTIALRKSMKAAAEAKAENGVISVNDLVREINEESLAEEAKSLHEVQLLLARSERKLIIGNGE